MRYFVWVLGKLDELEVWAYRLGLRMSGYKGSQR